MVGAGRTYWSREFQRMGEALEKSWRPAWEKATSELESRRSWEEQRGRFGQYLQMRLVI